MHLKILVKCVENISIRCATRATIVLYFFELNRKKKKKLEKKTGYIFLKENYLKYNIIFEKIDTRVRTSQANEITENKEFFYSTYRL